jgi:hypothetical protein
LIKLLSSPASKIDAASRSQYQRASFVAVQVEGFEINDWLKKKIAESADELVKEKDCVGHLIPGTEFAACKITEDTMLPGEN